MPSEVERSSDLATFGRDGPGDHARTSAGYSGNGRRFGGGYRILRRFSVAKNSFNRVWTKKIPLSIPTGLSVSRTLLLFSLSVPHSFGWRFHVVALSSGRDRLDLYDWFASLGW
jgi:hypothetical protein